MLEEVCHPQRQTGSPKVGSHCKNARKYGDVPVHLRTSEIDAFLPSILYL